MCSIRVTAVTAAVAGMLLCAPLRAQTIHDPTEPTRAAAKGSNRSTSETRWRLESTLIATDRRIASINGDVVGVGDRVNNATVTDIQPHAVQLRVNGQTIEIRLDAGIDPKTSG